MNKDINKILDKRLLAIASHLSPTKTIADVGCDHGLLSLFVLKLGLAQNVVCVDISPKCLQKTKNLLEKSKLTKNATFVLGDGLTSVDVFSDEVVIAGMGGINISNILLNMPKQFFKSKFVLQPMNNPTILRKTLNKLGFKIVRDEIVFDNKKYYHIICAIEGEQKLSIDQIRCGAVVEDYRTGEYQKWLQQKISKVEKIISSVNPQNEKYPELCDYLNSLKKCVF